MIYLPQKIIDIIGGQDFQQNDVGMSQADVYVFPKHVLKIQDRTVETDNERDIVDWLQGQIPVPQIPAYCVEQGKAYTLMTRASGKMLCDERFLNHPMELIGLVATAMKRLWKVDVSQCPLKTSRLEERLKQARWAVERGLVDMEHVDPATYEAGGFANPEALLFWLEQNRPEEDIVLTHGDFCLPNVFCDDSGTCSFIDLGKMGPADRWQDVAIAMRSLKDNLGGAYSQGKVYLDFQPQMLLDELGIEMNEEKFKYYLLLDELA